MSYNGWKNYETWLVNLHFGPETKENASMLESLIEEEIEYLSTKGSMPMFTRDVLTNFLHEVDFDEIIDKTDE